MATRLINNLGEGGPSSCVISVGSCSYWREHRAFVLNLFSGNLCRKCLCCVNVYVNECNSFENVLKYQYITDTFVFLGGSVH